MSAVSLSSFCSTSAFFRLAIDSASNAQPLLKLGMIKSWSFAITEGDKGFKQTGRNDWRRACRSKPLEAALIVY
jgi:hypothetical protein